MKVLPSENPLLQSQSDTTSLSLEQCYEKAWHIGCNRLLLQSTKSALTYDIHRQGVEYRLNGISLPISDYVAFSEHVLLTTDKKGLVQVWTAKSDQEACNDLLPINIQASKFRIKSIAKHTNHQFVVTDMLNNLSIWCIDSQQQIYSHKLPFCVIKITSVDQNVLNLIGVDSTSYKKAKFIIDAKQCDLLWETKISGIVDNLDIIGAYDDSTDKMTIVRKKVANTTDGVIWLEHKNKNGQNSLQSISSAKVLGQKIDDNDCVISTVSKHMPKVCFFNSTQNTVCIKDFSESAETLNIRHTN